jgi:hypothetical protein
MKKFLALILFGIVSLTFHLNDEPTYVHHLGMDTTDSQSEEPIHPPIG